MMGGRPPPCWGNHRTPSGRLIDIKLKRGGADAILAPGGLG